MRTFTTIGIDLAKKVFQIHGVDAEGKVVVARKLRRKEVLAFFAKLAPCLVGMEACGSAHYWAREIAKLGVDQLRALADQRLARAVQHRQTLLLEPLHRHERHARPRHRAEVRQGLCQARQDGCG